MNFYCTTLLLFLFLEIIQAYAVDEKNKVITLDAGE